MADAMVTTATVNPPPGQGDAPAKGARITKKDWEKVQTFLMAELEARKRSDFRQSAERRWREVDRQIAMDPMMKIARDGSQVDSGWHNTIELGELAKSSENMSADVRRIVFPQSRYWNEPHADVAEAMPFDPQTGTKTVPDKLQTGVDGRLRAFMAQQHSDFGLKDRVELSVKEALHHGSFVAEVDWDEQEMVFGGERTKTFGAGVWIPHSMWNCYPDPSPSVVGTNMFYTGTMFIERYLPRHKAEKLVKSGQEGYMASQWRLVKKDEHKVGGETIKDVKITTYWGDIVIERSDGNDLYFPNHKAMLFNGVICYMAPNETPYVPIIFRGYERPDVRSPYYTSPIVKLSPTQKLASTLANKAMDGIELILEPPIVYDGNDPDFVLNGGPEIRPGAKVSSKGKNAFQQVQIGDPMVAITGLQWAVGEMKEKLGRPGKPVGDRATKAEVVKASQDQEVSLVDFIDKVEVGLRTYLYMQHELNLRKLTEYSYYSPEMDDPDFLTVKRSDLPKAVHFEVVGARGVLGEQERNEKVTAVTVFASGNPLFAPLLEPRDILTQMYQDAGAKNAETFVKREGSEDPAALKAQLGQATKAVQQLGQELQQEKSGNAAKMAKVQADAAAKQAKLEQDAAIASAKIQADYETKMAQIQADAKAEGMRVFHEHLATLRENDLKTAQAAHAARLEEEKLAQANAESQAKEKEAKQKALAERDSKSDEVLKAVRETHELLKKPRIKRAKKLGPHEWEMTETIAP